MVIKDKQVLVLRVLRVALVSKVHLVRKENKVIREHKVKMVPMLVKVSKVFRAPRV